jgi:hypothetical protein
MSSFARTFIWSALHLVFVASAHADLFDITFTSNHGTIGTGQFGIDGSCMACREDSGLSSFVATFQELPPINLLDDFDNLIFVRANTSFNGSLQSQNLTYRFFRNGRFTAGSIDGTYAITPLSVESSLNEPVIARTVPTVHTPEPISLTLTITICALFGIPLHRRFRRSQQ